MLDPKFIRENAEFIRTTLKMRRDKTERVDMFLELDQLRRELLQKTEEMKRQKNESS
ncbi:MAG: serine--tRNA ligase, partial [Candidatus Omnitrophica bacterium]|nr:serine--tRNA ligase [Candidatus Omnitrophota bacterium]MBU1894240.1 serine--tRNA ligase [Candidatus Omnitrophota bacterium]